MNKKNVLTKNAADNINQNKESDNDDPWGDQEIKVVGNAKDLQAVIKQLQLHCEEYNVIGISCNLKTKTKQKIALLQLASHRGLCALVRMNHRNKEMSKALRTLLEDKNIIKVCVNQVGDKAFDVVINLIDYGIRVESILDLRYLAQRLSYRTNHVKLPRMSVEHLKVKLEDDKMLEQMYWNEHQRLTDSQIKYAAKRVRVAIELFKKFENELMLKESTNGVLSREHLLAPYLNQVYPNQGIKDGNSLTIESYERQRAVEQKLLQNRKILLVSNTEECRAAVEQLREHCNEYKVLGFDCKYTSVKRTVRMLKLATHRGLCVLIRCLYDSISAELRELLEDKTILKVGDKVCVHANKLEGDYGIRVSSILDLKDLARGCKCPSDSLKSNKIKEKKEITIQWLAKEFLNIDTRTLDWRLLMSDWTTMSLREEINYAAKTVCVMIELFKLFEEQLVAEKFLGDRTKFLDLYRQPNREFEYKLPEQEILIVNDVQECRAAAEQLEMHCDEYNVLGFDCEWLAYGRRKIALLQLATHRGLCVLIRLCKFKTIPKELRIILENEQILKVGVLSQGDADKLFQDYGVNTGGTFDLLYLARKCKLKAEGLGRLSEEVLNLKLEHKKRGKISKKIHNRWELDKLPEENIQYAANDAHVAIEIFKKFETDLLDIPVEQLVNDPRKDVQKFIDTHCIGCEK